MKKLLITVILVLMSTAGVQAVTIPSVLPTTQDTHYYGAHDFSFNLGIDGVLSGRLEFAVYSGSQAEDMIEWSGYTGQAEFVYAYQVFCDQAPVDGLTYFALTGINPSTIADVQNDIREAESLDTIPSGGVEPASGDFNTSVTKAIWQFDGGTLIDGDQSWFLLLYSNYDWIAGDIEVLPSADDDIPIPGDGDNEIPEPATLVLLIGGAVLSFGFRK